MTILVAILATLGFLALLRQWFRALLRSLKGGVETYIAKTTEHTRANRGDLTGMQDAQAVSRMARRARMRALVELAGYTALLATPLLSVWGKPLYAFCSALWLLEAIPPRKRAS